MAIDPETWWKPPVADSAPRSPTHDSEIDVGPEADPASVIGQWLRFYGPRTPDWIESALGISGELLRNVIEELIEDDVVIAGSFVTGSTETQLCDRENLEHLLALLRRSHRPVVEAVEPAALPGLWAHTTRMIGRRGEPDPADLAEVIDILFAYPAPCAVWESDILPARMPNYYPIWLDGLMKESDLTWFGTSRERIAFALRHEIGSTAREPETELEIRIVDALSNHRDLEFFELCDLLGEKSDDVTRALWAVAWSGAVSNDSYETLRRGILSGFQPTKRPEPTTGRARRPSRGAWARSRPLAGRWFKLPPVEDAPDPIAELEDSKDRVRLLLGRYGILFRELLDRELPAFKWSSAFRALRMMELSGEVVAGSFMRGLDGIQFATPVALTVLSTPTTGIYWMNATDPASPCGLSIGKKIGPLPPRVAGNHLVFRGHELVLVSKKNGRELMFHVEPDDPDLSEIVVPLSTMVSRNWNPKPRVIVETINDEPSLHSKYAEALTTRGFRRDHRRLVLSASYR